MSIMNRGLCHLGLAERLSWSWLNRCQPVRGLEAGWRSPCRPPKPDPGAGLHRAPGTPPVGRQWQWRGREGEGPVNQPRPARRAAGRHAQVAHERGADAG
jgi:hypothetical protein